jgi:hypothetical protein
VSSLRAKKGAVGKEELAGLTGYSALSGGFNNALSKLRTLGLIHGRGAVALADDLWGRGPRLPVAAYDGEPAISARWPRRAASR